MTKTEIQVAESTVSSEAQRDSAIRSVAPLVSGMAGKAEVALSAPSLVIATDEDGWSEFLADEAQESKRRVLLKQIEALLELSEDAASKGQPLEQTAEQLQEGARAAWETGVAQLLDQNRSKETAVRGFALFLENLQTSRDRYRNKIHTIDASAKELTTATGLGFLKKQLDYYLNRPDPRESRGFMVVQGWVGGTQKLSKLSRLLHESRCMLIGDAPSYDDIKKLEVAGADGGLLEGCPGEEIYKRHTVLLGNHGRARHAFVGKHAREAKDLYVPISGPWFGMFLDSVAQGEPVEGPDRFSEAGARCRRRRTEPAAAGARSLRAVRATSHQPRDAQTSRQLRGGRLGAVHALWRGQRCAVRRRSS